MHFGCLSRVLPVHNCKGSLFFLVVFGGPSRFLFRVWKSFGVSGATGGLSGSGCSRAFWGLGFRGLFGLRAPVPGVGDGDTLALRMSVSE